jgi:uncharacterized protein
LSRILLLLVLAFIIYVAFKAHAARARVDRGAPRPARSDHGEDMVSCARCGVNMPRSEARDEGGRLVCHNNPQCS